jgi:hypothetical protein
MGRGRAALMSMLVAVVAACPGIPLPGAIGGPTIVEGVFLDRTGAPVPNAEVTLSVSDWAGAIDPGDQVGTIYEMRVTTDSAGRSAFPRSLQGPIWVGEAPAVELQVTGS